MSEVCSVVIVIILIIYSSCIGGNLCCAAKQESQANYETLVLRKKSLKSFRSGGGMKGARVGIIAKPSAEFVAGLWATWLSGAVAVPLALNYPETELLHILIDAVCL